MPNRSLKSQMLAKDRVDTKSEAGASYGGGGRTPSNSLPSLLARTIMLRYGVIPELECRGPDATASIRNPPRG